MVEADFLNDESIVVQQIVRPKGEARTQASPKPLVENQIFSPDLDMKFMQMRKPPEEEFFMMLLLAYKINHPSMNKICDIDSKKLFGLATVVRKIPFFEY